MRADDYREWYAGLFDRVSPKVEKALLNHARSLVLEGSGFVLPGGDLNHYRKILKRHLSEEDYRMLITDYRKL